MEHVMMKLGNFKFSIHTVTYQKLTKTYGWVWAQNKRFGQIDSLQYTGKKNVVISLPGVIFPQFNNVGTEQLKSLEKLGDAAKPHLMISGLGEVLGYWVVTGLTETEERHMTAGIATKQSYTLEIMFYDKNL